jgi:hypothetical protein
MKRHETALGIMEGARNVRAIAKSLVEAVDEASGEGVGAEVDAAVRMIVHRLARLCKVDEINYGYDAVTLTDTYCVLMHECRTRAKEGHKAAAPRNIDDEVILIAPRKLSEVPESMQQ